MAPLFACGDHVLPFKWKKNFVSRGTPCLFWSSDVSRLSINRQGHPMPTYLPGNRMSSILSTPCTGRLSEICCNSNLLSHCVAHSSTSMLSFIVGLGLKTISNNFIRCAKLFFPMKTIARKEDMWNIIPYVDSVWVCYIMTSRANGGGGDLSAVFSSSFVFGISLLWASCKFM